MTDTSHTDTPHTDTRAAAAPPADTAAADSSAKDGPAKETPASDTLLMVREPFRGFVKGQLLAGLEALAVLASEHLHHVVVLRRGDPAA